jgi:hypothetical protein
VPAAMGAAAVASNVAVDAGNAVERLTPPGQSAAPGDVGLPGRTKFDGPFSGTQQLLLVIDATLTPQGFDRSAFERTLTEHGIAVEGTVPVDVKLEASLLASRFFEPAKAETDHDAAARKDLALVYVKTLGGHMEEIWRAMRANPSEFSTVTLDVAFLANDLTMFQELRRAVNLQPVAPSEVAAGAGRARRAAAHRLALSPSWRGSPVDKLKGINDFAGLVPDWMLGKEARKELPVEGLPGQPAPATPLPPGGRLGENIEAEVLFVVHVGRIPQE